MCGMTVVQTEWVKTGLRLNPTEAKLSAAQLQLTRTADWLVDDKWQLGWKVQAMGAVELVGMLGTTAAYAGGVRVKLLLSQGTIEWGMADLRAAQCAALLVHAKWQLDWMARTGQAPE